MVKPVIEVEGLSKLYRLGLIGATTIRDSVERWMSRARGKPKADNGPDVIWALKDVSFSVGQGEIIGIIGKNGAGKTTLLKILSRITEPTSGRAIIRGRTSSLLEVGTGFHPELTGRDNIYLNGAILGMRKSEIGRKFDEIVAFAEVEKFIDTPVKHYSSGMYVRLAFAVAAHLEPEILLVDEVLAVGDFVFQRKCLGKMGDMAKLGRTVLFVSHNMGAVGRLCKKGIFLDKGRLSVNGNVDDAIAAYLASTYSEETERTFPANPSKRMQIRQVRLTTDAGESKSHIDLRNSIRTEIEFDVNQTTIGAAIGWMLEMLDGTPICHTNCLDSSIEAAVKWDIGTYKAVIQFPGNLLNSSSYTIRVGIGIIGGETLDHQECFLIHLYDSGSFGAISSEGRQRLGLLLLQLPWEIVKVTGKLTDGLRYKTKTAGSKE